MKTRLPGLIMAALAVLAFGAVASACGGGGDGGGGEGLTLERYFQRLAELDKELTERSDELGAQLEGLSEDEIREQAPGILGGQLEVIQDFVDGLDELVAPADVADAHEREAEAGRELERLFAEALAELRASPDLSDPFLPFETVEMSGAGEAFTAVCRELEEIAADSDISVDLNCREQEE